MRRGIPASHWPFPEFHIPTVPGGHLSPVTPQPYRGNSLLRGHGIDSEPQEIECEMLSELGVCIPEGDE